MSDLSKVCLYCSYFKNDKCCKLSDEIDTDANSIIGYIEDGVLSENIRESIDYNIDDLSRQLTGLVAKTKVDAVVQAVQNYLESNENTFVERIDDGVSSGLINNYSGTSNGDFIIKNPMEFSCKYYW